MSSRLYGDHFIMAFPSFDTATNRWVPQADVSWNHNSPRRKFVFIRFPTRCKTEAEAVAFALDMTQAWIDEHPERLHSNVVGSERGHVIDVVQALKESVAKRSPKQTGPTAAAMEERVERSFTFEQFKSLIAEKGIRLSEQTLQKSYAALVKLSREKHLSWAEARRKVEYSHPGLGDLHAPARRLKTARIPLTERDWRKIG
jgi:alkanesulfonate monooxygenase SsuD/methylene tetrahydromethanopterin reductase-like flavin-dependent oxidoreductase (luciferase family)